MRPVSCALRTTSSRRADRCISSHSLPNRSMRKSLRRASSFFRCCSYVLFDFRIGSSNTLERMLVTFLFFTPLLGGEVFRGLHLIGRAHEHALHAFGANPCNAAMRSAIGGCVEKIRTTHETRRSPCAMGRSAPNGFSKKRWAVALVAVRKGREYAAIFPSADARPSGYRVSRAPEASARNSRLREIAMWI